jgi:hypothetical protein
MIGGNFTTAPWHICIDEDGRGATIYALRECVWLGKPSVENRWQAQVAGDGQHITSSEEVLAVARMMRAAPDLRDVIGPLIVIALDNLHGMDPETREQCEWDIRRARAAIAKAEGGAA